MALRLQCSDLACRGRGLWPHPRMGPPHAQVHFACLLRTRPSSGLLHSRHSAPCRALPNTDVPALPDDTGPGTRTNARGMQPCWQVERLSPGAQRIIQDYATPASHQLSQQLSHSGAAAGPVPAALALMSGARLWRRPSLADYEELLKESDYAAW